jgi:hypothetical protein
MSKYSSIGGVTRHIKKWFLSRVVQMRIRAGGTCLQRIVKNHEGTQTPFLFMPFDK